MEAKKTEESSKKKFQRKVAPSKAPRRLLKKKLRDLERLVKNKNSLKDMPDEVIQETEKKIADVKKQIEALGPDTSTETQTLTSDNSKDASSKKSKGLKFTELRRAGRRISAFKKQHPNYETSEEESKALEDLELDILYIKNFPKGEEYISIYPESPLEDEAQVKMQVEIREKIAKARANGELKNLNSKDNTEESPKTVIGKHPASNWSDEEEGSNSDEEEEETHESKKQKSE